MASVTLRIKTVSQPSGGYVPRYLFQEKQYNDYYEVKEVEAAFTSIQGSAVDYLTRYLVSNDKQSAFRISRLGAERVDEVYENHNEIDRFMSLLEEVTGLDDRSIYAACRIVGYDSAFRMGVKAFRNVSEIVPPPDVISNIRIMTKRGIAFLKGLGTVVCDELNFEGGYTALVDSGDADYLAGDTLVDFKVSKLNMSTRWSLQLLMYYLLGFHSIHKEYKSVHSLCIFNPYKNKSYICDVDDISDESKYKVSNEVIGYKMCDSSYSNWNKVNGTDPEILNRFYRVNIASTGFEIENYSDGIHEISVDDYWTYMRRIDSHYWEQPRPLFKHTKSVLLIKHNGYVMFLSRSYKGSLCVLNGARLRKASFSPEYYFANMERYAEAVIMRFSKYWDALYAISTRLKRLTPDKESLRKSHYSEYVSFQKSFGLKPLKFDEWYIQEGSQIRLSGRVHGCIVDIDYSNHIYLNPNDGTVVPYSAESMFNKDVYKNTISLIAEKRPEMLESLKKTCADDTEGTTALIVASHDVPHALVNKADVIDTDFVKVYSHDMYAVSNKLKPLQSIYDKQLIQIWYDEVLHEDVTLLKPKYLLAESNPRPYRIKDVYLGKTQEQKGNHFATVIAYNSFKDIDVKFEDGIVLQHVHAWQWKQGNILHPDVKPVVIPPKKREKSSKKDEKQNKNLGTQNKYLGVTKKMNCGLNATIVEYINCKDVTVQFEDGVTRRHVRPDHFMDGKVAHKGTE